MEAHHQSNNEEEDDDDDTDPIKILLPNSSSSSSSLPTPQFQNHYIQSISSTVIIRQLPSQGLSFQLWPAAKTLCTLLDRYKSHPTQSPLSPFLTKPPNALNLLELGSGTGLVGITAALTLGASVTLTDLPHVLENLKFNAEANKEMLALHKGSVHVVPLKWGEDSDAERVGKGFDVILASDVVYHDHLYEPLIKTLKWFLGGGGEEKEKGVVFLMAHLRRWKKKESLFFKRARKLFDVKVLFVDEPLVGSRIGVVVYRFVGRSLLDHC